MLGAPEAQKSKWTLLFTKKESLQNLLHYVSMLKIRVTNTTAQIQILVNQTRYSQEVICPMNNAL